MADERLGGWQPAARTDSLDLPRSEMTRAQETGQTLSVPYDHAADGTLVVDAALRIVFADPQARRLLGMAEAEPAGAIFPAAIAPDHPAMLDGVDAEGQPIALRAQAAPIGGAGQGLCLITLCNLTRRHRRALVRMQQSALLEHAAAGAAVPAILHAAIRLIETHHPGSVGTVMLADPGQKALSLAASTNPTPDMIAVLTGLPIGPDIGSCGRAAYERRMVITADIANDPNWRDYRAFALDHQLAACWSIPILSSDGELFGTFAVYARTPRQPAPDELELLQSCAHIACISIAGERMDRQRRASQVLLANAERLSGVGAWQYDTATGLSTWSEETFRILDLSMASLEDQQRDAVLMLIKQMIHPDDLAAFLAQRDEVLRGGAPMDIELRLVRPHRATRVVQVQARLLPGLSAGPGLLCGTVRDITGEHEIQTRLRQNTLLLQIAGQTARLGGWVYELTTHEVMWSDEVRALYEAPADAVPSLGVTMAYFAPEWQARMRRLFAACTTQGTPYDEEVQVVTTTGRRVWVRAIAQAIRDGHGDIVRVQGALQDITWKKQSEAEIRDRDANLVATLDSVSDAFFTLDRDWRYTFLNTQAEALVGRSRSALLGRVIWDEFPEAIGTTIHSQYLHAMATGEAVEFEAYSKIMQRWLGIRAYPSHVGLAVYFRDTSQRRKVELEMARTERALRLLTRCGKALIHATDERQLLQEISQLAVDIGGYKLVWVGYAAQDGEKSIASMAAAGVDLGYIGERYITWDESHPNGRGPVGTTIRTGEAVIVEDFTKSPSFQPWLALARRHGFRGSITLPLRDGDRVFGVLGLYSAEPNPVTADEISLLQELADNLSFGIMNLRAQEERRQLQAAVSKVAAGVSGRTGRAFFNQLVANVATAVAADIAVVGTLEASVAGGGLTTMRTLSAIVDGRLTETFTYGLAGTPCEKLLDSMSWVIEDGPIGPLPEALRAGGAEARAYVGQRLDNSAGRPIGVLYIMFRRELANPALKSAVLQIFAARAAAELERQDSDYRLHEQASLLDRAHDAIIVRDMDSRILYWNKGAESVYGWKSEEVLGKSAMEMLHFDWDAYATVFRSAVELGEYRGELPMRHKDGRRLIMEIHWTLVTDEQGHPKSILAINTDITQRRSLEEKLHQSQRLEAVGQLTGGIAHDFNNLLTVITLNSEILMDDLAGNPPLLELARVSHEAASRGADLTRRLLAFARRQPLAPRSVNVGELLSNIETMLRRTFSGRIDMRLQYPAELWHARVDPAQFEAAVMNLALNARDAMPGGGVLTIAAANVVLDQADARTEVEILPGAYVMIAVSDTGTGIAHDIIERVFDPFFTTKDIDKGTGLGLSMVYGFVKQSGGHTQIQSEQGVGTTVRLYLPRGGETQREGAAPLDDTAGLGGAETILVVEDDEHVRQHAQAHLTSLGYRVLGAANGPEALAVLGRTGRVDLLFTDMVMPLGISGQELAARARALQPDIKILYTSGYTENAVSPEVAVSPAAALLLKPYSRLELARMIRATLSGPGVQAKAAAILP